MTQHFCRHICSIYSNINYTYNLEFGSLPKGARQKLGWSYVGLMYSIVSASKLMSLRCGHITVSHRKIKVRVSEKICLDKWNAMMVALRIVFLYSSQTSLPRLMFNNLSIQLYYCNLFK
jgi:hypothetical protein